MPNISDFWCDWSAAGVENSTNVIWTKEKILLDQQESWERRGERGKNVWNIVGVIRECGKGLLTIRWIIQV